MSATQPSSPPIDDQAGLVDLLKRLTDQGTHLAQQQVALVQVEIKESIGEAKASVAAFAGAAVLGVASLGVLLMGLAYLLADVGEMTVWAATLIVGAVAALVAFILYRSAAGRVSAASMTPERSIRTIERTPDAATGKL